MTSWAAPGGDYAYPGADRCQVGTMNRMCWVFDMYLSTSANGAETRRQHL